MLAALASADPLTWVSILVKAGAYAATLAAIGAVLAAHALRALGPGDRARLARAAALAAVVAAALTLLRLPLRAGFLMGGSLAGATDPMLLTMVAESPLGDAVAIRLAGLALIAATVLPGRAAQAAALAGAVLAAASFAFRGHALEEPRPLLGALVTLHILGLSFWVGALAPLARAARGPAAAAGALAREFGARALWVVGALALAGAAMLALFGALTPAALSTPYGQAFAAKLALFAGVLSLAALNKLRLTPALLAGAPGAGARLRRSIAWESLLIAAILLVTAAATTLSAPPGFAAAGAPVFAAGGAEGQGAAQASRITEARGDPA